MITLTGSQTKSRWLQYCRYSIAEGGGLLSTLGSAVTLRFRVPADFDGQQRIALDRPIRHSVALRGRMPRLGSLRASALRYDLPHFTSDDGQVMSPSVTSPSEGTR